MNCRLAVGNTEPYCCRTCEQEYSIPKARESRIQFIGYGGNELGDEMHCVISYYQLDHTTKIQSCSLSAFDDCMKQKGQ